MSASHRKISRLPISVFQDLITRPQRKSIDSKSLKSSICNRLKKFRVKNDSRSKRKDIDPKASGISSSTITTNSIQTVGQLLRLPKYTLVLVLDPILTYEEVELFLIRVCNQCAPKPRSVLRLLDGIQTVTNIDAHSPKYEKDRNPIEENRNQSSNVNPISFGNEMRQLPTCIPSLDRILRGGVRLATVTELVGRSGVGKTQLAMQLCIVAAKFNQGAIYIDTEKKLSLERLKEMSEQRRMDDMRGVKRREIQINDKSDGIREFKFDIQPYDLSRDNYECSANFGNQHSMANFKSSEIILDNLTVHRPGNSDELLDLLGELEYEILLRNQNADQLSLRSVPPNGVNTTDSNRIVSGKFPVRLLILDSIAAPIRRDFGVGSAPRRAATIFQCAQKLKRLADQLHLAIVVINQVGSGEFGRGISDCGADNVFGFGSDLQHNRSPVRAALGTCWHHCVSTRLLLERKAIDGKSDNGSDTGAPQMLLKAPRSIRMIAVLKSSKTGYGETDFKITTTGIVEA